MTSRIVCSVVLGCAAAIGCASQEDAAERPAPDAPDANPVLAAEASPEEPEEERSLIDRLLDGWFEETDTVDPPPSSSPSSSGSPSSGSSCLGGTGDFSDDGPYDVAVEDVTIGSLGAYTIFYPDPLDSTCPHPIVAWGNGTAVTGSNVYAFYQEHAASWGIVVIASHNSNVGSGEFHTAGLDYLLSENEDPNSKFYGKLSARAGTSGHSQGGAGASAAASHPNVEAIGNVQGSFGEAPPGVAFLCLTGTADIATSGCQLAVESTSSPALYANWDGGDHISTSTLLGFVTGDPGTLQYRRLYTAWFRCFLADDDNACAMFEGGADCPVCRESGWAEIFANNY